MGGQVRSRDRGLWMGVCCMAFGLASACGRPDLPLAQTDDCITSAECLGSQSCVRGACVDADAGAAGPDADVDAAVDEYPVEPPDQDEPDNPDDPDEEPDPDAGVEDELPVDAGEDIPDEVPPQSSRLLTRDTALHVYRGDLHAHSSFSDDAARYSNPPGPPSECYARAKRRGFDFLGLSDHVTWGWATDDERQRCLAQARDATTGTFLAMCGLETSVAQPGADNHANVFFYSGPFDPFSRFHSHRAFFDALHSKTGAIGQFNHPSGPKFRWAAPTYSARVDGDMELIELNGGPDTATRRAKYVDFLNKGWHVAPTYNSDSHTGRETGRSAFWARELTGAAFKDAVVNHRSFIHSTDGDRSGRLKFFAADYWFGATLVGLTSAPIRVDASHPRGIARVEVIGPGGEQGTVLKTLGCAGAEHCVKTFELKPLPRWIFVKAIQSNGNWMLSAPMWFER